MNEAIYRSELPEGWGKPLAGARSFHYFRDSTALCRRWMLWGGYSSDNDGALLGDQPNPDDCKACWRKRKQELTPWHEKKGLTS